MTIRKLRSAVALAMLALVATISQAQTTIASKAADTSGAGQPAAKPATFDDCAKEIKNPTDWLSWGADLRVRNEYFNNALALSHETVRHEQDYFRIRERWWVSIMPVTNLSVNARLAGEQRDWMKPSFARQFGFQRGLEARYGILDNANVKWNNAFDLPLSALTVIIVSLVTQPPDEAHLAKCFPALRTNQPKNPKS